MLSGAFLAAALLLSPAHAQPAAPQVLRSSSREPALPASMTAARAVKRMRAIDVDLAVLADARPGTRLALEAFPGVPSEMLVDDVRSPYGDLLAVRGTIAGGQALIVAGQTHVAGFIQIPSAGTFRIMSTRTGHAVVEVDESHFPECAAVVPHVGGNAEELGEGCDDGTTIDVIIIYTNTAADDSSGDASMETEAVLAVELTNMAYENSGVLPRLRLRFVGETTYDEDGSYSQHLDRLREDGDEYMDEIHDIRDEYGADLVGLFVADSDFCGIAYLHDGTPASEAFAFSVTTWWCAGQLVLAHEMGHNQGCCHAPGDGGGCDGGGLFSYSWGHRFTGETGNTWRTVMAYAPGTRIPHFSNPAVSYDNQPTGIAVGTAGEAHNVQTINQTAFITANYRCSIDTCDTAKLRPIDPDFNADFGSTVALQGALAVMGAPRDDTSGLNAGAAEVHRLVGSVGWTREAVILAGDSRPGDAFGTAVAIDGGVIAIGGPRTDEGCPGDPGCESGAAHVFTFDGVEWTRQAKLLPPDAAPGMLFGSAIAIRDDVVLVGAPQNALAPGAGYVFRHVGAAWQFEAKLVPPGALPGDGIGAAVALRGNIAVLGAAGDDGDCPADPSCDSGAVYVFSWSDTTWTFVQEITAADRDRRDWFGRSVSLGDGTIAVGAPGYDLDGIPDETDIGAAYVYRWNGATWIEEEKLINPDIGVEDEFGDAVAIEGELLIVGVPQDDDVCPQFIDCDSGSAYVFHHDAGDWPQLVKLVAHDDDAGDHFGSAVSLAGDLALVGAERDFVPLAFSGSAFVFPSLLGSDCNENGLLDFCEVASPFTDASGALRPLAPGVPLNWTIAAPPPAATDVVVRIAATADLEEVGEYIDVLLNGVPVGRAFEAAGQPCATPPNIENVVIPRDVFADAVGAGPAAIRLIPSADVDENCLPLSYAFVSIEYGTVADCNANGVPDSCDIESGTSADANGDSIPDECAPPCPADISGDGAIGFADLLAVLAAWGPCPACPEDLDGDGAVGFADLLTVLAEWGPCE
jgi:hypothetical protein